MKQGCLKFVSLVFMSLVAFIGQIQLSAQTELPDSMVMHRIQSIQQMLNDGKSCADKWWYGWLAGYSAATIAQGAVYLWSNNKSTRQDMALGAATTLLGAAGQLLTPNTAGKAPDMLFVLPENTITERLSKLQQAEKLLQMSAMREKKLRSWQTHLTCGAVNISSGLITWLAFKRTLWDGIGNFALNTAITETQIWTQPTKALKDYRKYKSNDVNCKLSPLKVSWEVTVYPGRVGLSVLF